MSGVGRTEAVSVHKFRRTARKRERRLQGALDAGVWIDDFNDIPGWTQGVRVEKIGRFCFAVIATEKPGH
jgi:hypothetical protein